MSRYVAAAALLSLVRKRFRAYVHPPERLERAAAGHGLRRTHLVRGAIWETAQFEPAPPS